jgi:primosomal protein N' (replication factor Y) (superfamily II helicase)
MMWLEEVSKKPVASTNAPESLVQVAVAAPVRSLFTYAVPVDFAGKLVPGHLLEVPFGRGNRRGIMIGPGKTLQRPDVEMKAVSKLVEPDPVLSEAMIRTLLWAADYYLTPPGEMVFAALPPPFRRRGGSASQKRVWVVGLAPVTDLERIRELTNRAPLQADLVRVLEQAGEMDVSRLEQRFSGARQALRALEKKGLVRMRRKVKLRHPLTGEHPDASPVETLTADQQVSLDAITTALERRAYAAFLLHGVTGSGKTEVYLRAISHVVDRGQGAILLVPEISLTPQLVARVTAKFKSQVAVLHSGLGEGERLDEWRRLRLGQARVAVGARSAVFAPVQDPGIVVVDEEHDSSYKQSERLPYSGRDLAMVRAREEGAVVVLGTATPSVESFSHAERKRSTLLHMGERVHRRPLPEVEVVDLKKSLVDPVERQQTISPALASALAEVLDRKEQAILFLNRRGYSSFALCKDCGRSIRCENCSVALVYHRADQKLKCHYCGLNVPVPETCPSCESGRMQLFGLGTEKCEEEVRRRFPGAGVIRLDSDTTARRGKVHDLVSRFARGEADVLLGTQMVTKGHDVPGVTLVGVLLADLGLHLPDFRAMERTFQLLVQVAGRAGRGHKPGRVIIQTFLPEHESIVLATHHDFDTFVHKELARRQGLGYPPATRLLMVRVNHHAAEAASSLARQIAGMFRAASAGRVNVLGPVVSPLAKLRGRHRWQMLIKAPTVETLMLVARTVQQQIKVPAGAKILFDVDPQDML